MPYSTGEVLGDTVTVPFVPLGVAETVNVCFANLAVNVKSSVIACVVNYGI